MDQQTQQPEITHATIRSVVEGIAAGQTRTEVLGLVGSSGAYLLASELAVVAEPVLVVAPDNREAERFAAALAFYHGRPDEILLFPHWEIRPYEPLSPHPEVEAARLTALAALHQGRARAVVMTTRALLQRVIPRAVLAGLCETLKAEEDYPRDRLTDLLPRLGYNAVPLVEDRGTFSVRGDIIDIFPPSLAQPVRLEFFGDTLERLRPFDAASQRSNEGELQQLQLLPAREMVLAGDYLQSFSRHLKERCDALELPRSQREAVLEEAREGLLAPGRQFLLPLTYGRLDTVFDYAPKGRWIVLDPPAVEQAGDRFAAEVAEGEARMARREEPYVEAASMYLTPAEMERELSLRRTQEFAALEVFRLREDRQLYRVNALGNGDIRPRLREEGGGLASLADQLRQWRDDGWRTLLVCHQKGQAERLLDLLEPEGVRPVFDPEATPKKLRSKDLVVTLGELPDGFRLPDERFAVITEEEIFGQRVRRRPRKDVRALLSSLAELKEGDYVVHADHGIGRYHGLQHLSMGPTEGDFLHLEYAGGDKLYLPVERIEKVQKYVGGEGQAPRLDKMGGGAWEKAKLKARAAVEELARDLLKIYARREMSQGFRYSQPDRMFREFEAAFPYEETPDQLRAIQEVLSDMESERPVDRLVCGDVGYGKTEVAIRAAFRAALDGRQVAVLVPTTVLARQHGETFRERFKGYPVEVDMISRFRSASEQKQVLERTAGGQVDILIGTHRLLQRDVRFKNLGLVIIDEEQRFGVTHKERLKKLRAEVDVITLTATPIPRTLHMSMMGMRDLSVIETPPVDRLAVRTYVTRFDDDLIREAILRELRRGGQVFFVHNRVQNIGAMAEFLRTLVPEASIAVGHGQMGEKALEQVMVDFIEGKTQVLVCSTIIENGIDIPRANTIIINRADCFGLSQLYQLRGRVGRSNHRAYAYLLIPGEGTLTREARERLRVLQDLTELGAGFRVASHDLELRGAGDLLGARQAGQIAAIGFEMYAELLEETIHELQGLERDQKVDPEVRLGLSAFLPEKYLPDPNQRLVFYKQLAAAEAADELYDAADELRDRYGELPESAELLIEVMKLRVLMKQLKVELAEYDGRQLLFSFHATTPVPPERILKLMEQPGKYRFSPDYRLSVQIGKMPAVEVLAAAKKELQGFL
ncbi:MAG: transcription-repair coupling factor [Desulfuromonadaceae bacterium GWC2_58_13]|nr:MAG: transcription-repair coupling factor [Desulfuromonadaceae bacterium GWC2_58_13]